MTKFLSTFASLAAVTFGCFSVGAGLASAQQAAPCADCAVGDREKQAQPDPSSKAEGQVVARRDVGREVRGDPRPLVTCCDPVLGTLNIGAMFGKDSMPGGNFGSNYGITFNPTAAFSAAMNNTSFIANVTGGVSPGLSWLLLVGELRTDNVPLGTPMLTSGNLPTLWNIFTPLGGTQNLAMWDSPAANVLNVNWGGFNPFVYRYAGPVLGAPHMRADGTRYILKLSYVMAYQDPTGHWQFRQIECNNARVRYVGFTINSAATRASGGTGAGGALQVVTAMESGDQGSKSTGFSQPIPSPDMLIKQMRGGKP